MGTEASAKSKRVLYRVGTARRQVQFSKFRIGLLEIGNGRDNSGLQSLDGNHVFNSGSHRVAGESLGVGYDNLVRLVSKHGSQGVNFSRGTAAASRCVGLVRHEQHLWCDLIPADAVTALHAAYQLLHHAGDVLDVETCSMKSAVERHRAKYFAYRQQPAFPDRSFTLNHQGGRTHAHDHAVPATVERRGRILDVFVGSRCSRSEEA